MPKEMTKEEWWALPISHDFMFAKVMSDTNIAKDVVELLLELKIGKVRACEEEKSINITHDSKSVRLDVYLRDEDKVVNVEMQVRKKDNLAKRSRYYSSVMDLGLLEAGHKYSELPTNYVVFICLFDLFHNGKARNSFQYRNDETGEPLNDGTHKIFYNATAETEDVNPRLQAFLKYVCGEVTDDDLVQRLEEKMNQVKSNEKWRTECMKFEIDLQVLRDEALEEGIEQGKQQGKLEGIEQGKQQGKLEGIEQGKQQGKLEGLLEGKLEGLLEGKLEEQFKIAKKLLGKMGNLDISELTGLSLSQIEALAQS